jgi:predicted GNAT family N-acyltransferase
MNDLPNAKITLIMNDLSMFIVAASSEMDDVFAVRKKVLVEERKIPLSQDLDGMDQQAIHISVQLNKVCIGCARMLPLDRELVQIGRIAIQSAYHRQGIGTQLMRFIVKECAKRRSKHLVLDSYLDVVPFYLKNHFWPLGLPYLWKDGYLYQSMHCKLG